MKKIVAISLLTLLSVKAPAAIVFQYPVTSGALIPSSWVFPEGSDSDIYSYDKFTVGAAASITDVDWIGGYIHNAQWGRVNDFSITFYASSNANGFYPLLGLPDTHEELALAQYELGSVAEEQAVSGGLYRYHYTLPTPFDVVPGQTYWIRIEGYQPTLPDWGIARGTGGNGSHIQYSTGTTMFRNFSSDEAFTLSTSIGPAYTVAASALPENGGSITGAETFAPGAAVTLTATAAAGYTFIGWEEAGNIVSTSETYSFTAEGSRNLVAKFTLPTLNQDIWMIR